MRVLITVALAAVVWAALFGINTAVQSTTSYGLTSALVIAAGTVVRQLNSVERRLASPKSRRSELVEGMAQGLVVDIVRGRKVTECLEQLRVHVWEVPAWYRRLFPFWCRCWAKRVLKRRAPKYASIALRPTLRRTAGYGLRKQPPTGVRFRKGEGLVGVCIANNDRTEVLSVDVSQQEYQDALKLKNEQAWLENGPDLTRNLSLEDARKLAGYYGTVIARVIQDPNTGEPIGCTTLSLRHANGESRQILRHRRVLADFEDFSRLVAPALA